jgi:hypothetical protein
MLIAVCTGCARRLRSHRRARLSRPPPLPRTGTPRLQAFACATKIRTPAVQTDHKGLTCARSAPMRALVGPCPVYSRSTWTAAREMSAWWRRGKRWRPRKQLPSSRRATGSMPRLLAVTADRCAYGLRVEEASAAGAPRRLGWTRTRHPPARNSAPPRSCIRGKQQSRGDYRVPCDPPLGGRARPSSSALLLPPASPDRS